MQNYYENLKAFNPIKKEKYFEITVPVAMDINHNLLKLYIKQLDNGYMIYDDGQLFKEYNSTTQYYYNLFINNNEHNYDIKLKDDRFYKTYPDNFNIQVAINEFVRFFVYLDDYILDNDII
ncbi:MAG TPA: hypothetical protein DD621_01440 [Clostridiales bacterium]|nr:hypothetical protein [Clostridiales bacterium]